MAGSRNILSDPNAIYVKEFFPKYWGMALSYFISKWKFLVVAAIIGLGVGGASLKFSKKQFSMRRPPLYWEEGDAWREWVKCWPSIIWVGWIWGLLGGRYKWISFQGDNIWSLIALGRMNWRERLWVPLSESNCWSIDLLLLRKFGCEKWAYIKVNFCIDGIFHSPR